MRQTVELVQENVFLAASRRRDVAFTAKILDFGIAKLVEDSRQKTGTQPLGTPLFMAPEQTDRKGRICPATDVWALGLIAFKLLTGRDFWREADGGSLAMLLTRNLRLDPRGEHLRSPSTILKLLDEKATARELARSAAAAIRLRFDPKPRPTISSRSIARLYTTKHDSLRHGPFHTL